MQDKLFRFARRITQHDGESEDIVQEVFIRLWDKGDVLTKYRNIEALAMVMVKNLSLDYLKSARSKSDTLDTTYGLQQKDSNPYQQAEISNTLENVKKVVAILPEQQRMVFHLRDIEQYDFEEIAEITKLSVNNVRVTLSRARKAIRQQLIKANRNAVSRN